MAAEADLAGLSHKTWLAQHQAFGRWLVPGYGHRCDQNAPGRAVYPTNVDIETLVNGERRQRFNAGDMVFTFGEYLEHLSPDFTFYPGDIISGGTVAGTAADSSELLPTAAPARSAF